MTADASMIGAKLGEGREAEIYAWGDSAVLKLYRPGFAGHHTESLALAALAGQAVAPRLIEVVEHDGRTGVVLQRLSGTDMLTLLQRQPWRVRGLGISLAEAHVNIHGQQAPSGVPDLRELLAERIRDAGLPGPLRGFALGVLEGLPDADRLCHGDYHPGNLLICDGTPGVIDWAASARGAPEADHARTLLLLRWANPLPGTALLFRGLIAAGRSLLATTYGRHYRQANPGQLRHVQSWLTVNIAARLSEGIDAERTQLTGLLERARNQAR